MPEPKRGRILNVDDNEAGRYTTTKILKKAGFDVIEAANGTDALTLAATRLPDLVLLDVNLPDISGFEVCKRLKEDKQTSSILVVHQSAMFVRSPDQVRGLEGGADGYLVHPIDPDVLVATLLSYLRIRYAEKALRESEEKYRSLFENMLEGFAYCRVIYDNEGRPEDFIYLDVNAAFNRIIGTTTIVNKRITEVFPGIRDTLPEIFEIYGRVALTGNPETLDLNFKAIGKWLHISVYSPAKEYFVAVFEDITERKRAEEALRASEERYHRLFETAQDGIIILDGETGKIIDANAFILELLGYPLEYFVSRELWELGVIRDKSLAEAAFVKLRTEGYVRYEDLPLETKGGQSVDVEFVSNVYLVGEKKIIQCNIRNITDRKRAEDALAVASRKLNLLSGITRHDIRNQLLALSANLEFSKEFLDNPVRTSEFIVKEEKIVETIGRQISFTKDYEDLGGKASVWQKVNTTVGNVITRLPMRNISVDAGDPDLEIYADPLLEKVFYNLFDNALQYGGEQLGAIRVTTRKDNEVLVIAVEDDGTGISAEDKNQLFTKGFGRHTGLGLFLSKEILAITGITITENGEPGKGARFEITVPEGMYRFPGQMTDKNYGGANRNA